MNFQCKIAAGTFHPYIFNPVNKAFGPITVRQFFWYLDPVEVQDRLDLVLAASLFLNHTLSSSDKTAVFNLRTRRDIYALQFSASETSCQFAAVDSVGFLCSFLVLCWYIGGVDHKALYPMFLQTIVNPETTIARFINRLV